MHVISAMVAIAWMFKHTAFSYLVHTTLRGQGLLIIPAKALRSDRWADIVVACSHIMAAQDSVSSVDTVRVSREGQSGVVEIALDQLTQSIARVFSVSCFAQLDCV
jgi:hypothetical protein